MNDTLVEKIRKKIKQASDNANEEWKEKAKEVAKFYAMQDKRFTSENIIEDLCRMGYETHNYSALGSILQRMSREGSIKCIGYAQSNRPSRHKAPVRVWKGLIMQEMEQ